MNVPHRTRVKICCIQNIEEARMAIQHGADALGLVSAMPSGPGPISDSLIAEIVAAVPPPIATFLLTSAQDAKTIIAQQRHTRVNTLQLVDAVSPETHQELRHALPGISLVQVIHVTGEASYEEALSIAPYVDALLLDSGNPSLAVKELGGTGRVHDWTVSRRICESVAIPIFLAGGLNASNAAQALSHVAPFGLDICSGVRTNDILDETKLADFFSAVHHAHPLRSP